MNNKGISFFESLFAVTIIFIIASFLLPQFANLKSEIVNQRVQLHASEVARNAARTVRDYHITNGKITIDDVDFIWQYKNQAICVSYQYKNEDFNQCITKDG